jgi:hypothetical protein
MPPEESFDGFYESKDQLFVFLKASTPAITSPLPLRSALPIPSPPDLSASDLPLPYGASRESRSRPESSCPASPADGGPVSDYVRDFRTLWEVRVLGKGVFGVVKLLEDPSTHHLIAVKFFDSETTLASDKSSAFFREIDALVLLTHPCILRIVGYCLATRASICRHCADTSMRLIASHGPAQSHIFDNPYSLEPHNGRWFHHREDQHTVKDRLFALFISVSGNRKWMCFGGTHSQMCACP